MSKVFFAVDSAVTSFPISLVSAPVHVRVYDVSLAVTIKNRRFINNNFLKSTVKDKRLILLLRPPSTELNA